MRHPIEQKTVLDVTKLGAWISPMDQNEAICWAQIDALTRALLQCDPGRFLDHEAEDMCKGLGLFALYDRTRLDYEVLLKELAQVLRRMVEHAMSPGMAAALRMTLARIELRLRDHA